MKRTLLLCLLTCTLTYLPFTGNAGPKEDYEEAYKIYIAAGASAAAYSDRLGELVNHYLEQDGWKIDHYVQAEGHSGARYLIAQKEGFPYALVAIVGTENDRDIKTDLKVDKVYFAGSTPEEFVTNAAKQDVPATEPKVHRGFNQFVEAGLSAVLLSPKQASISFTDLLQTNQSRKLLLTGHSLGGAAATLAGARLLSGGINPDQLEVITFGAPAVGNAAFAHKFSSSLHLTRIVNSGDIVTGALQTFVGGYQQFGQQIKWHAPDTVDDAHQLIGYIDSAIKNYYDKRRLAISTGIQLPIPSANKQANLGRVYVVPLINNLPKDLTADFLYMQEALQDEYQQILPDYVTAKNLVNWQNEARASGCRWAVVSDINATPVKQKEKTYYITLTQTVYDVTSGIAATTATFSTVTYNLTPLEAFIHNFKGIEDHLMDQFAKNKGNDTIISPAAKKP